MKYVILIYNNPASRAIWAGMSPAERGAGLQRYARLNEELSTSGELIVSEALADPALAKRVAVQDDHVLTTDGPFAEVKEQLAGFFLLECDSLERAIEHAARVPEASLGLVEVRPVLDLKGLEM
jgi:hypothetical protein